jgi:DNA-binding response OmpR family regulator
MKVTFISVDSRCVQMAAQSVRLRWPDMVLTVATTATEGLELVEQEFPDVVLMNADFTDMSLSQAIQELRRFSDVPLIVMSHRGDVVEVVTALELGADDYVRLPCNLTEMMSRLWALLRRAGNNRPAQDGEAPLRSGSLLINPATYEVFLEERRVSLTSTEFRLLHLLVRNQGVVLSHQALERGLWGRHWVESVGLGKKYIQRLRRKLGDNANEPHWIVSVRGVGYRFIGPKPTPDTPVATR